MPIARYFLFVGGVLLALLLAIDALFPQQAVVASRSGSSIDKTVVRIRSDQKPPERVVYDTSLPTIVPSSAVTAQVGTAPAVAPAVAAVSADAGAQARVRETYAQYVPAEAKKPEPQVQRKRKVAKIRPAPPMQIAQPQMRVAQQSHFGFFGGSNWNSTW
jgi:hypothetical protein